MVSHTVTGGDGITLAVETVGPEDGQPIVLIHGYTQSRLSWRKQLKSDLTDEFHLVAFDNRGHGASEKPEDAYGDSKLWADDVNNVIDELGLEDPVLVGWSYGGLIISDYLEKYGDDEISGIVLAGAITKLGTEDATAVIGDDFLELVPGFESTDAAESVRTLETFIRRCTYADPSQEDLSFMLGFNTKVPPYVREGLHSREVTHDGDLEATDVPVLLAHGDEDTIVLPAAAEEHADLFPSADVSAYPDTGHSVFWERPDRFNRELREFVDDAAP